MAKRAYKPKWPPESKPFKDEEEVFSYDYEGASDFPPVSDINSFLKLPPLSDSSKENVELSLEVEIADSLKHLIASPERRNSALLDVTIVRPPDLDCVPGLETANTLAFKSSEVRNLIASMERQKQYKKKLIEECRKKATSSKMNPINETHEIKRNEEKGSPTRRKLKKTENAKSMRNNIAVNSAPSKPTQHVDHKLEKKYNINTKALDYKSEQVYANSTPIAILKPLVGEIKQSLKNLEASIEEVGDYRLKESKRKQEKRYTSTSDSNVSNDCSHYKRNKNHFPFVDRNYEPSNAHQVYTTANTYDKLRNLLACQSPEQRDQDSEKPCMCQHCGMVGLLVESQKRPIVPTVPLRKIDGGWPKHEHETRTGKAANEPLRVNRKEFSKGRHTDLKRKYSDDNFCVIRDLTSRLEALEMRVTAQEQQAVPKDYFKRIINKLWQNANPQPVTQTGNLGYSRHLKDHATQYSAHKFENATKLKKEPKVVKRRNVQIQQNSKKSYCVNPVLIAQTDSEPLIQSSDTQSFASNKNVGTKAMAVISEFFTKKSETSKKCSETDPPKEKLNPIESFWRWGEEIIKPGFDLKTKIISLLDERFQNIKNTKTVDPKNPSTNESRPKISSSKLDSPKTDLCKTKSVRNTSTSPVNLLEVPEPFEDKETLKQKQEKNEEKTSVPKTSSRTLKKMLDMMSEKIYNDHVKPTVEAIKQEQKSFNNENTKQIYNIKAAMDAALCKINPRETRVPKTTPTNEVTTPGNGEEWRKDFLEPLQIPASIKNPGGDYGDNLKASKLSKRSAIPVRVTNASPTDSTASGYTKYKENKQSLIPRLKSPGKDYFECVKPIADDNLFTRPKFAKDVEKPQKRGKYEQQHRRSSMKKEDTYHMTMSSTKSRKNMKSVQIKYMNPKAEHWNEESCASVTPESSENNNQVMLKDNSSRGTSKSENHRHNNRGEERRISHKHSVTDKLAFLTNITKAEMGKAHIWNNILKQAKNHCRSKQDTVIIQIPTETQYKHNGIGITEVEFTIDDIQKLVNTSNLPSSGDVVPQESVASGNMESFLLIRSRKILQEVHRRLGNKFLKN